MNDYPEDYIYSDNNGSAEMDKYWEDFMQQEMNSHTHPIKDAGEYCLRHQMSKCKENHG